MSADLLFDRLARALSGRYTLVRELGQGGMATVYLGTDVKLGRRVAIKVLAPATRAALGSGRFQREVLLAAHLSHPHIVPLFEADEADGLLFYVMGYVEGESLKERLQREGPLPLEEAVRIASAVGDALQYAHESGVIHRDVKPGNILLLRGHAMVTDFGIAKLIDESGRDDRSSLTGSGIAVGTAEYMSPEQASGEKRIDARADVYGLAAVLYEMLAGKPPFTGPSVQGIVARVLGEAPRPIRTLRPTLPGHVERALSAGLAKLPADRPASARAFVSLLTRRSAGRPRTPARQVVRVSLGTAVLVAVAWLLWPRARSRPPSGMTLVPGGFYTVGGGPGRAAVTVALDSFYIDSAEVAVAAFRRFLASTGGVAPWRRQPADSLPVTSVLWSEAQSYCLWRDSAARLPTEHQWEAAARGPRGWRYPWGQQWETGRANAAAVRSTLAPVGQFTAGRSWVGAVDLVGNASEWTANSERGRDGALGHVIKGGAFNSGPEVASAAYRSALPDRREWLGSTGFRCAWTPPARAAPAPAPTTVAVLYFDNLSADTADAYLADGLTEGIIGHLAQVGRLEVKASSAIRRYRGDDGDDPATLGRALRVAHLVSGSVSRVGDRVRVTVELVHAKTGMRAWGGTYDTMATDLQATEEDIARAVATAIAGQLAPGERTALAHRTTGDPAAYDHFLRGNYYLAQRSPRAVRRAIQAYEAAERADPGFAAAPARVALGYAVFLDWGWEYPGVSPDQVLTRGFAAADRALEQDSAAADAWMARGFLLSFRDPQSFAGVSEALRRAIALDPNNAEAYHQYGMTLLWLDADSAAADMYRRALAIDPERAITLFNLARLDMRHERYREAQRWLDSALSIDPAADYAYVLRALTHLRARELPEARADGETAARLHAGYRLPGEAVLVLTELAAADTAAARRRLERLDREVRSAGQPSVTDAAWVGRALVAVGESRRALQLLERARPRGARLWFYLRAPEFDALRADARFQRLAEESRPK
jgi:TolB-like protein/Tfp pilus assembly protein PilF